ncbi:MAG: ABC transporter substrate-binding protein [Marivita sp.]|uniref:ABC transporter substrate-binding protein n=1 Tax=Marivita sp. TaxID=2003365 RepID=UPI0025BF08EC|nr:ABC transporter substrate-binding protein [Marivita sp.]MCI5111239.1 ABC transporter substrate-binding protein [Marivita sp.]
MLKTLKSYARSGALVLAGLAAGAAEAQDTAMAPLDPPQDVKVAYVPIMKFATMYVAEHRGLFDKHGLNVDLERVKSGTEAIAFLTQGTVDVGGIAIVTSLWSGWNKGLDIRIIAPGALEPMEDSPTKLLVRKALAEDGTVTSVADLNGRRVAVAGGPGSGGEYLLAKALERGRLTIRDIEPMNVANPDMPLSFENGAVDAAIAGSPFADQILAAGNAGVLETDLTPGLMTVAFVGSGKLVNDRPEVAERFVLALTEAAALMQGEDYLAPENIEAYMTYTNSTEEALRAGRPVIYDPEMKIPVAGLADIEKTHRENGRTEYTDPLDLSNVIDERFTEAARKALGK